MKRSWELELPPRVIKRSNCSLILFPPGPGRPQSTNSQRCTSLLGARACAWTGISRAPHAAASEEPWAVSSRHQRGVRAVCVQPLADRLAAGAGERDVARRFGGAHEKCTIPFPQGVSTLWVTWAGHDIFYMHLSPSSV